MKAEINIWRQKISENNRMTIGQAELFQSDTVQFLLMHKNTSSSLLTNKYNIPNRSAHGIPHQYFFLLYDSGGP